MADLKRKRRSRREFLLLLQGEDFEAARAALPGSVVIGSHSPAHCNLRLFPLRSPDGFEGYHGYGKTPMEALRDAAWNWLDARKGVVYDPA
jgi:hypothetical protein